MEETLHALGGILLRALPTFLLVALLHFYLKYTFFKPLKRVLDARYEATEGARKRAEETLEKAAAKAAEYEQALRSARAEIYQSQEQFHRKLQQERAAQLEAARASAEEMIGQARSQLALDVAQAKIALARETEGLAEQIAEGILHGRPA
jgi:F-type H+-transporting ATPase subunit b